MGWADCACACAAAPDTRPIADASAAAQKMMAELGKEQLAEAKRQYDQNYAYGKKVADAQLGIMQDTNQQAKDYYNYQQKTFRPVEESLVKDAMNGYDIYADNSARGQSLRNEAESMASRSKADINRETAMQKGATGRAMKAMGVNPNSGKFASANRMADLSAATAIAGSSNNARTQVKATDFARRMDAAGLGRNLAGASQGAYNLAINSGNSAAGNQSAAGGQLMAGMGQAAGTTGSGYQMALGGLGSALNAQTSYANSLNASMAQQGGGLGDIGSLIGAGASAYMAFSDPRLKESIELVGKDERTGLNLYHFEYINGDGTKYRGVMSNEVEAIMPDAVEYDDMGYASVNYGMLGIEFKEVGHELLH